MAGSIRRRTKGSYSIRYDGPPGADGRRRQKEEAVKGTRREADRLLRQRQQEVDTGAYAGRTSLTVNQYVSEWLDSYGQSNIKPVTRDGYLKKLRPHILPTIGGLRLRQVRPHHLASVYGEMARKGLSAQTILHVHRVIHVALAEAVKSGLLPFNPASRVTPPKVQATGPSVWNLEEVQTFLAATNDHPYREYYRIMVYTGLRSTEMAGLRWNAVDFDGCHLFVVNTRVYVNRVGYVEGSPKTRKARRMVSFGHQAAGEFARLAERQQTDRDLMGLDWDQNSYVFADALGLPIDARTYAKAFKGIVVELGLPYLTPRNLRHIHATLLLLEGVNTKVVSERLGHSSIRVTADVYSHVLPELDRAAGSLLDDLLRA